MQKVTLNAGSHVVVQYQAKFYDDSKIHRAQNVNLLPRGVQFS